MTEEEIMDELVGLAMDWALGEEPVGAIAEVTEIVEVDPVEWVTPTAEVYPDRAFVVNVLLDYAEVTRIVVYASQAYARVRGVFDKVCRQGRESGSTLVRARS